MTIFTASNVSTRKYSIILCTDYSTFNVTHKLLKQVPDSVKHMFRLKTTSDLQNQFCKPKVSFWKHTIYSFSTGVLMFFESLIPWLVSHLQSWIFHSLWVPQRLFLHNSMPFLSVSHRWALFEYWLPTSATLTATSFVILH